MMWSLERAYEEYPQIEEEFSAVLDASLRPRCPRSQPQKPALFPGQKRITRRDEPGEGGVLGQKLAGALDPTACELLGAVNDGSQGVTVIGISGTCLGVQHIRPS